MSEMASGPGWTLHMGDCLDPVTGLASLADKSVDHVITDPPYSEWTHAKVRRGGSFHAPDRLDGGPLRPVISTSAVLGFDALSPDTRAAAAAHAARAASRWLVVFSDSESVHLWASEIGAAGALHVRTGAWVKIGGTPQFTGDRPGIGHESIEIAHAARKSGKMRWNGGGRPALWSCAVVNGPDVRVHSTQKPLDLMLALVRDFTDPGELVCDPFAGSGTTGVACLRLGRRFVGWERDPKYHAIAVKRLSRAREQLRMFEVAA